MGTLHSPSWRKRAYFVSPQPAHAIHPASTGGLPMTRAFEEPTFMFNTFMFNTIDTRARTKLLSAAGAVALSLLLASRRLRYLVKRHRWGRKNRRSFWSMGAWADGSS